MALCPCMGMLGVDQSQARANFFKIMSLPADHDNNHVTMQRDRSFSKVHDIIITCEPINLSLSWLYSADYAVCLLLWVKLLK